MKTILSTLFAGALLASAGAACASVITYSATLNGANEEPFNVSLGTGTATMAIDNVLHTMALHVEFSGLTGMTTAAHIHCCTPQPLVGNFSIASTTPTFPGFPLGVTAGSYDNTFDLLSTSSYNPGFFAASGGSAVSAEAALLLGMAQGRSYLNIHTITSPGGEIRGFLVANAVPEPGGVALLAAGGAMLFALRRRERRE